MGLRAFGIHQHSAPPVTIGLTTSRIYGRIPLRLGKQTGGDTPTGDLTCTAAATNISRCLSRQFFSRTHPSPFGRDTVNLSRPYKSPTTCWVRMQHNASHWAKLWRVRHIESAATTFRCPLGSASEGGKFPWLNGSLFRRLCLPLAGNLAANVEVTMRSVRIGKSRMVVVRVPTLSPGLGRPKTSLP